MKFMTRSEFYSLCNFILLELRKRTPYDTGNLANNATNMVLIDPDTMKFYVDGYIENGVEFGVAPYVVYVNEPWISPKWGGKKNPNEHYWNNFCEVTLKQLIAQKVKGTWKQ